MTTTITRNVLSATTLLNNDVRNSQGEDLGEIEDLMIDLERGRIRYAVLSFGGFLGMGEKFFAVPFEALNADTDNERFILDLPKEKLENAPGFDKNDWPSFADTAWQKDVHAHYGTTPYWERS